jgi:cobalamin synthase
MKPALHYAILWGSAILAMIFLVLFSVNAFLLPLSQTRDFRYLILMFALSALFAYLWSSRFELAPDAPTRTFKQTLSGRPFRRWALAVAMPALVAIYAFFVHI